MNIIKVDASTLVFMPGSKPIIKDSEYYRDLKESYFADLAKEKKEAIL
ncbi:hypothetical protein IGK74_002422 [Enterococcus sp. AZ150]